MSWLEPALTVAILAGAVFWAVRRTWRSLRRRVAPGQSDTCATASAGCGCGGCPVQPTCDDPSGEHAPR
jgi:hypothetical protein